MYEESIRMIEEEILRRKRLKFANEVLSRKPVKLNRKERRALARSRKRKH